MKVIAGCDSHICFPQTAMLEATTEIMKRQLRFWVAGNVRR
jgi:hypothetical protein